MAGVADWLAGRRWLAGAALVALCLLLFAPGFARLPPVDRDEASFAQASRQMLETGDFVDIRLGAVPRHKKPAGIYWIQAAVAGLVGGQRDIAAYRLVSLFGAIGAVLLTQAIGMVLAAPVAGHLAERGSVEAGAGSAGGRAQGLRPGFGRRGAPDPGARAGLMAAALLAGCLMLGAEARLAKTDAVLLCAILASQWVLARLWMGHRIGAGGVVVFWGALAVATLVKGPIGPMVVGLTVAGLTGAGLTGAGLTGAGLTVAGSGVREGWRWLLPLRPWRGLALWALIVLPWVLAITWRTEGAFWGEAVGRDLLAKVGRGQEAHGAPPGSYLLAFWVTFWPGSVLFALAMPALWARRGDRSVWFCAAWVIPVWLVFEFTATKLVHYTLPTYPALAVLAGLVLAGEDRMPFAGWRRWLTAGLLAVPLILLALLGWEAVRRGGTGWFAIGGVAGGIAAAAVLWRALASDARAAAVGWSLALSLAFAFGSYPTLARVAAVWPSAAVGAAVAGFDRCTAPVVLVAGYGEPSVIFAVGTSVRLVDGATAGKMLAALPCGLAFVAEAERAGFDNAGVPGRGVGQALGVIAGTNLGSGKAVRLFVFGVWPGVAGAGAPGR